jgi:hypothetical protein
LTARLGAAAFVRIMLVCDLRSEGRLSQISIEDRGSTLGLGAVIRRVLHERQLRAVHDRPDFLLMRNAAERHLINRAQNGPSL